MAAAHTLDRREPEAGAGLLSEIVAGGHGSSAAPSTPSASTPPRLDIRVRKTRRGLGLARRPAAARVRAGRPRRRRSGRREPARVAGVRGARKRQAARHADRGDEHRQRRVPGRHHRLRIHRPTRVLGAEHHKHLAGVGRHGHRADDRGRGPHARVRCRSADRRRRSGSIADADHRDRARRRQLGASLGDDPRRTARAAPKASRSSKAKGPRGQLVEPIRRLDAGGTTLRSVAVISSSARRSRSAPRRPP